MAVDTAAAPILRNARAPNRSRRLFRHHKNPREIGTVLLQMLTAEVGPFLHSPRCGVTSVVWGEADSDPLKPLSNDKARRIATTAAKLPEPLSRRT